MTHQAGYVSIIGRPNVGKSTLMNLWLGEKLSIISPKAQTTRHRILGIYNDEQHQIVFSDTPGIVFDPIHSLHHSMNNAVNTTFQDADIIIYISEVGEKLENLTTIIERLKFISLPKILVLNKCDLAEQAQIADKIKQWDSLQLFEQIFPVIALQNIGAEAVIEYVKNKLPYSPPYYPKDQLSDKNERFFVTEIIREKILNYYQKEIPYSVEVVVEEFKENKKITHISILIFVERDSQKGILIGKNGLALKQIGVESRKEIEKFLAKNVFLALTVKVLKNWRENDTILKQFGYKK